MVNASGKNSLRLKMVLPVGTVPKVAARLLLQARLQSQVHRGLSPLPEVDMFSWIQDSKDFLLVQKVIRTVSSKTHLLLFPRMNPAILKGICNVGERFLVTSVLEYLG